MLCADDAHNLDAATLTLVRRLVWASRSLPLAVLVTARPDPSREPLTMLIEQAQIRLRLPPMGPMMVERLVYDRTGRWPGPLLRRVLGLAAGNPLFVAELLTRISERRRAGHVRPGLGGGQVRTRPARHRPGGGNPRSSRQLDQPTRDVLAAMAVWGTDVGRRRSGQPAARPGGGPATSVVPVAPVAPVLLDGLDERLERAISSGLVRRDPAGTVGFSHDLFREAAYGELAEPGAAPPTGGSLRCSTAAGYRPSLVADHLLGAGRPGGPPGPTGPAAIRPSRPPCTRRLRTTRGYAPEVTADLLDDLAAMGGGDVPDKLLLDQVDALFHQGSGKAAETLDPQADHERHRSRGGGADAGDPDPLADQPGRGRRRPWR